MRKWRLDYGCLRRWRHLAMAVIVCGRCEHDAEHLRLKGSARALFPWQVSTGYRVVKFGRYRYRYVETYLKDFYKRIPFLARRLLFPRALGLALTLALALADTLLTWTRGP